MKVTLFLIVLNLIYSALHSLFSQYIQSQNSESHPARGNATLLSIWRSLKSAVIAAAAPHYVITSPPLIPLRGCVNLALMREIHGTF